LPQVEAGAAATQLDEAVSSSVQPVTSVTAQVAASQILWSDQAATNVRIQRDLRRGRDSELVEAEQDLAYDVAVAFVQLQRAQAVIGVRAADIDRARLSLRVARQRTAVGDAAASEVSRWEGEVANARAALVQSWTEFRAAMIALNVVCGVDVERRVTPAPGPGAEADEELRKLLGTPRELDRLATVIGEIAAERAPELLQIGQILRGQQRQKGLAGRSFYMPTLSAQASANFNLYQAETEPIVIPGAGELTLVAFPTAYWAVGASATVPVFSGGQRRAEQLRAGFDVASTEEQQRQLELAVRSRAVIAVNEAHGAAWQADLRQQSAEASLRSFESTQSSYAAGSATQTSVTEARTNALQVGLSATDARYEAVLRYIDVLRSVALLPTPDSPDAPELLRTLVSERLAALDAPSANP
jgi:outer membrane protein